MNNSTTTYWEAKVNSPMRSAAHFTDRLSISHRAMSHKPITTQDTNFMKSNKTTVRTLAAILILLGSLAQVANASIQAISFDMGPDNVFTVADATAQGMTVSPSAYGTLGRFNASGLLCIGPFDDLSGVARPSGLFNVDPSGSFSTPKTFPAGTLIDGTTGLTGWGVISANDPTRGLTNGTYNLGFKTSTGNFGWMNVTLNENGTPKNIADDIITINAAFVETVVGQGITVASLIVTTAADSGAGSLRQTISNAPPGTTITFATNLSGATILLTSGEMLLNKNLTIDASALPGGLAINGNTNGRIFQVTSGSTVVLDSLTIMNGKVTGNGGGIYNSGTLTVNRCTLAGNSATTSGGGIFTSTSLIMNQCTLTGNSADSYGGAIEDFGTVTLNHCTIALNHVTGTNPFGNGGGGIDILGSHALTMTGCIVAGNTSASGTGPEIWSIGATFNVDQCLIGDGSDSELAIGANGNLIGTAASPINPLLAPLANYGGPTHTMPPLPGSPAIDAGGPTSLTTDQRGFPRVLDGDLMGSAEADIGAVELENNDSFANRISIFGLPASVFGFNINATAEPGEPDHVTEASKSVWWTWTSPTNGLVSVDTVGSSFDTVLAVYTGSSVSNLVLIANNDEGGVDNTSRAAVNAIAGTTYQIAVDGYEGDNGSIVLNLAISSPEIAVESPNGTDLLNGDATFFGNQLTGTPGAAKTFTILNTGTENLILGAITKDGANPGDFTVGALDFTTVIPGDTTTLTVTFTPGANGPRSAALHIANNDSDENPFDLILTGTGAAPEIAVEQPPGTSVPDGGSLSFGTVTVGTSNSLTITIRNTGLADLTLGAITKDGANPGEFTVSAVGNPTVMPGNTTTFSVTFKPTSVGAKSAVLHLANNDADENPFDLLIYGATPPPQTPAALPDLKLSKAGAVRAIVVQPDGKMIVGGSFTEVNDVPRTNLARLNANGSVDLTWNPPQASGVVSALAISATDLFIGGNSGLQKRSLESSALDSSWNPSVGSVNAMALTGTNLYVGGSVLKRIGTTGSGAVDPSWNPNPSGSFVSIIAILVNGTNVFVAGRFDSIGGVNRDYLVRLSAQTGLADPSWNVSFDTGPGQSYQRVHSLAIVGTNLFVGGEFQQIGGFNIKHAAKVSAISGAVDPGWNTGGCGLLSALAATSNHVYMAAFNPTIQSPCGTGRLFRTSVNGNGTPDPSWSVDLRPDAYGNSILTLVATETSLLVGSDLANLNGEVSMGIMKLDQITRARDRDFSAQVQSPGVVRAMARQPDGKVIIGGDFGFADGLPRQNLARINLDGTLDRTWAPSANDRVHAVVLNGNDLFVGGRFTKVSGIQRHAIAKIATQGSDAVDTNWNASANATVGIYGVMDLALDGTNLFAAGGFSGLGGISLIGLAKLSISGSGASDPSWRPNLDINVLTDFNAALALAVDGTSLFVGGSFPSVNGVSRRNIAKLTKTGSGTVDSSWNPQMLNGAYYTPVSAMVMDGTNLFVGGAYTNIGGQIRHGLAKLSTQGSGQADPIWDPAGASSVTSVDSLALIGTNLYVGGWFTGLGGGFRQNLAKVNVAGAGALDLSFNPGPFGQSDFSGSGFPSQGFNTVVWALFSNGGDLYVGGGFTNIAGAGRTAFAFLPVAEAPVLIQDTTTNLFVLRNPVDGPEVTHFRIIGLSGGPLFKSDGIAPVNVGDFITVAEGAAGLKFVPGGSLSAVSAFNSTPAGAGTAVSSLAMVPNPPAVLAFSPPTYSVREGQGNVVLTVRKYGDGAASVIYATSDLTATAGLDYQERTSTLSFSPAEKFKNIIIAIADDLQAEGEEQFAVNLSNELNAPIVGPRTTIVTIADNDGLGVQLVQGQLPTLAPQAGGVLVVNLDPSQANGQWRLVGELNWHNSGDAVSGLVTGNYAIEFRPVTGYFPPSVSPITVPISAGTTNPFTFFYAATPQPDTGNLSVRIEPGDVAGAVDMNMRGQWRRQGTTNWLNHGEMVPNLSAGSYAVEFKSVPGRATPLPGLVQVGGADAIYTGVGTYLFASAPGAAIPEVVPFGTATTNAPYLYNGQLQTSVGFGSGFVVKKRVVLTAAHVLFDDVLLNYSTETRWFFQRYRDQLEPVPQVPRGWYIFDGYAGQRQQDNSPGLSTPASQNLDVAALYFLEDAGRGGYGGYLSSDADDNEYLLGANNKFLAGYPLEEVALTNQGKLFATAPANVTFAHLYTSIFATTNIQSFPGNSGGPLYVQTDVNTYLPAALLLGGAGETLVRAINSEVVDLINRAEISGNGGGNISGGGVTILGSGVNAASFGTGQLTVSMSPLNTAGARPGWRVKGDPSTNYFTNLTSTMALIGGGSYPIEFRPVPGFMTPSNRTVLMAVGGSVMIQAEYLPLAPSLSFNPLAGLTVTGPTGATYRVEFATNLNPPAVWIPLTNLTLSAPAHTVSNTRPATNGTRFYRAVLVP